MVHYQEALPAMIRSDIVNCSSIGGRTFCIRTEEGQGTAFTIDVDGKRYLITAQHVIGPNSTESVSIESKSGQEQIDVELVGLTLPELDVAVLRPSKPIHDHNFRTKPVPIDSPIKIGEDVYAFGFHMGLSTKVLNYSNFPYPVPLLRSYMISGFQENGYFLDGFANPGASGGPVFSMDGTMPIIIGVVVARRKEPSSLTVGRHDAGPQVGLNSGIVMVTQIRLAMELIMRNPIGLEIDAIADRHTVFPQ